MAHVDTNLTSCCACFKVKYRNSKLRRKFATS